LMNFTQGVADIQDTLKSSTELATLAENNPALKDALESMSITGALDEQTLNIINMIYPSNLGNTELDHQIYYAHELAIQYNNMPETVQAQIETAQRLFNRSTSRDNRIIQAETLVDILENDLGVAQEASTTDIDDITANAIRRRLEALKLAYPEQDTDDIDPLKFNDPQAIAFLERVKQRQAADLGVDDSNSAFFRLQMLSKHMDQNYNGTAGEHSMGQTLILLDALKYINNGTLPSGIHTSSPEVDNNWGQSTNKHQDIALFNANVYGQALRDNIRLQDVMSFNQPQDEKWRNDIRDEAIKRILEKDANWQGNEFNDNQNKIKTLAAKLRLFEDNPTRTDLTIDREELGIIAIEMMSVKANEQGLEDHQIDEALRNGGLAIAAGDLHIIDDGMGVSQEIYDDLKQRAENGDLVAKAIVASEPSLANGYMRHQVSEYRAEKWQARFSADDATSVTPFEEYVHQTRYDVSAYERRLEQRLTFEAQQRADTVPTTREEQVTSSNTTSTFRSVVGSEDSDPAQLAALSVTGSEIIEGDLPLTGTTGQPTPVIQQTATSTS